MFAKYGYQEWVPNACLWISIVCGLNISSQISGVYWGDAKLQKNTLEHIVLALQIRNTFKTTAKRKRVDNICYNLNVTFPIVVILRIGSMQKGKIFSYHIKFSEKFNLYIHFDEESSKSFNEVLQVLINHIGIFKRLKKHNCIGKIYLHSFIWTMLEIWLWT